MILIIITNLINIIKLISSLLTLLIPQTTKWSGPRIYFFTCWLTIWCRPLEPELPGAGAWVAFVIATDCACERAGRVSVSWLREWIHEWKWDSPSGWLFFTALWIQRCDETDPAVPWTGGNRFILSRHRLGPLSPKPHFWDLRTNIYNNRLYMVSKNEP